MAIQRGLEAIQKYKDDMKRRRELAEATKLNWMKMGDGETVKCWFLQEIDEGAKNYSEKNGLGFFATEHSNPENYRAKASCSAEDEERCVGCEKHKEDWTAGWKAKSRLYINVLLERSDGKREVAVMSQANGKKGVIAPMVLDYAVENNTITDRWWKITRTGTEGNDTTYTPFVYGPSDDINVEDYEMQDLSRCVREIPYAEQEAHYFGTKPKPSNEVQNGLDEFAVSEDTTW